MNNKLGIGYITCDAPDRVEQTFPTIPKGLGELVVVNSGCVLPERVFEGANKIIQSGERKSVAISKNKALRHLMNEGCDHIFLVEDDVIIKDPDVFKIYVHAAQVSGIWHLNYGLQGALNRAQDVDAEVKTLKDLHNLKNDSTPAPRSRLPYKEGVKLAFYPHALGAFSYFFRGVIKNVGYFDERYVNAFENVDYTYRVIQKGLHPPFWWFADLDNSSDYLDNLEDCMLNSPLRLDENYSNNLLFGKQWFKGKFDCSPEIIPDTDERIALKRVNELRVKYSKDLLT